MKESLERRLTRDLKDGKLETGSDAVVEPWEPFGQTACEQDLHGALLRIEGRGCAMVVGDHGIAAGCHQRTDRQIF
jgi:hypothetical protein